MAKVIQITSGKLYRRRDNNAWVIAGLIRKGIVKPRKPANSSNQISIVLSPHHGNTYVNSGYRYDPQPPGAA